VIKIKNLGISWESDSEALLQAVRLNQGSKIGDSEVIRRMNEINYSECATIYLFLGSELIVTTSLNINEALLNEALALDNQVNIDSLVETALREYIQRRKRLKVLDLFGTIEYDESYNYKQQRHQA
jgi:hypothetical protein